MLTYERDDDLMNNFCLESPDPQLKIIMIQMTCHDFLCLL
jgi:hypothetical protein